MAYKLPDEIEGAKKEEDVGFFESALAGVATGLWNIPKGFVSLGAELYDLVCNVGTINIHIVSLDKEMLLIY